MQEPQITSSWAPPRWSCDWGRQTFSLDRAAERSLASDSSSPETPESPTESPGTGAAVQQQLFSSPMVKFKPLATRASNPLVPVWGSRAGSSEDSAAVSADVLVLF